MIASLCGRLAELELAETAATAVVEVAGVGYEVTVGAGLAAGLGTIGEEVSLSVHTHVREAAITLYGFSSPSERRVFRALLTAHGIGPALALALLGAHSPSSLAKVVAEGDVDALMGVPGVGRKTAQRLVVELAGRLELEAGSLERAPGSAPEGTAKEVANALGGLGYGPEEIRRALEDLGTVSDLETALRQALRALAPPR